jgi:hypothetical protein
MDPRGYGSRTASAVQDLNCCRKSGGNSFTLLGIFSSAAESAPPSTAKLTFVTYPLSPIYEPNVVKA